MAAITRIRKYFWFLVLLMVLALVSFILMDSMNSPSSGLRNDAIGKVNGKKINWTDFQKAENILYKGATGDFLSRRTTLWNYFVEEAIVSERAEKIGLGISNAELNELQFSKDRRNLSEVIVRRFTDQQTRQLDMGRLNEFKQLLIDGNLDENYRQFWSYQQKEIRKSRLQNKIANLVGKSAYTPTWMAEVVGQDQGKKADIAYVKIPFSTIADDQVELTDKDYKDYLLANEATYRRDEPSRKLAFVVFDIKATAKDSADIRTEMATLASDFNNPVGGDSLFVIGKGGQWDGAYIVADKLPKNISSDLLSLPIGSVVGPYISGGNYSITKILDRKAVPDSVKSRHILLPATDQASYNLAVQKLDSLKTLIEEGKASFTSLAAKFGTDATKSKGGDLGYAGPGQMVKPFNDLIFFKADQGKLYTVASQFGLHLVEVTGKKFTNNKTGVKLGTVNKLIAPSDNTQTKIENIANQFARTNTTVEAMKVAAEKDPSLTFQESSLLKENDYFISQLGSNDVSREFIQWAFEKETSKGEVNSNIYLYRAPAGFYYDKAVVGAVVEKVKAGLPSVSVMKEQLKSVVLFKKKGEKIASQISAGDLNSISSQFGVKIDTANNVAFAGAFIPGVGSEPKVIGATFRTSQNSVSSPIVGTGGVFVVQPINVNTTNTPANVSMVKKQEESAFMTQAKNLLIEGLKKKVKITDNRSTFY